MTSSTTKLHVRKIPVTVKNCVAVPYLHQVRCIPGIAIRFHCRQLGPWTCNVSPGKTNICMQTVRDSYKTSFRQTLKSDDFRVNLFIYFCCCCMCVVIPQGNKTTKCLIFGDLNSLPRAP